MSTVRRFAELRDAAVSLGSSGVIFESVSARIQVIDDEPDLLELVRLHLDQAGYEVTTSKSGGEAMAAVRRSPPDLVVLDLMLPDISGTEVCRRIRSDPALAHLPIIMLTARASEVDRVVGFELGADDYVTKPFSPRELALRVGAVLRRSEPDAAADQSVSRGAIRLDAYRHRCFVDQREITLTSKEFGLLSELMRRPGRVMTRDALLERVWDRDIVVSARTIDTHLKRLREKLGEAGSMVETVRGVGYRFAE